MPQQLTIRPKKTTLHQFGIMLDFFENHPEMINAKSTDRSSLQMRDKFWTDLTMLLNSVSSGAQKTPQKWRKTWFDIKSEAIQKDRKSKEECKLKGNSNPLPLHLARIMSLIKSTKAFGDKPVKKSKLTDQPCIIKDCFTEEALPKSDMVHNGNLELNGETDAVVKIETLSDEFSTSENSCFEKVYDIPSTSADNPSQKVSDILTFVQMTSDDTLDISNSTVQYLCTNISEIPSTSANIPTEENSEIPPVCSKTASENVFHPFASSPEISKEKDSNSLSKNSCEKVCDILTTSVKKLNDVIKNSENRTLTAFNSLTKATVKANELRERQLQIEEERNRLYQERNEILFTLVNNFLEKKVNHQH